MICAAWTSLLLALPPSGDVTIGGFTVKRVAVLPALALAIMPFVSAASTAPAHAATGDLATVSITVSMDLPNPPGNSKGPIVFQVTDVPVTSGPELTGANLVSNPSKWRGSVTVDVDNTTHHITVATEHVNSFQTATVTVTSPGLGAITLVSDNLWVPLSASLPQGALATTTTTTALPMMALTYNTTADTATIAWTSTPSDVNFLLRAGGAAVFSFTAPAPTTTTTTAPATTTTAPAAAAKAVSATPAFTG